MKEKTNRLDVHRIMVYKSTRKLYIVRILIKSSLLVECGSLLWSFVQRLVEPLSRLPWFKGTALALQMV